MWRVFLFVCFLRIERILVKSTSLHLYVLCVWDPTRDIKYSYKDMVSIGEQAKGKGYPSGVTVRWCDPKATPHALEVSKHRDASARAFSAQLRVHNLHSIPALLTLNNPQLINHS